MVCSCRRQSRRVQSALAPAECLKTPECTLCTGAVCLSVCSSDSLTLQHSLKCLTESPPRQPRPPPPQRSLPPPQQLTGSNRCCCCRCPLAAISAQTPLSYLNRLPSDWKRDYLVGCWTLQSTTLFLLSQLNFWLCQFIHKRIFERIFIHRHFFPSCQLPVAVVQCWSLQASLRLFHHRL